MNYEKLKKFDLMSIKSQEQANEWKQNVLESSEENILKYINYLRFQQFNGDITIKYMERIIQFLSYDELIDIERKNSKILTGEVEDLIIYAPSEIKEKRTYPIKINGQEYSVKAELVDDFENIVIIDNGEKLIKFGFIEHDEIFYAYELFEEVENYLEDIVSASVGTKINIYSDIVGENQVTKTFKKVDLNKEYPDCILTIKTNKGVLSTVYQGSYTILKKEDLLSSDGVSEDRISSHMSKIQKETSDTLVKNENEDDEKKYTKDDFEDNFKFSKKYCFSIDAKDNGLINPLSETILNFYGTDYNCLSDEYIDEVYQLLFVKFGIVDQMDGIWIIPNTKLESVLRIIVRSGGEIKSEKNITVSKFLERFIKEKLEKISNNSINLQVVKKIKTKKEVEEFVKDSGTELYYQMGQTVTAVLEGTQRLFGEGYIVFDSDHKLTICQIDNDKIDLVELSNFAIDNNYKNFYVIEKDKYTQYDAYYKETLKTEDN